MIPWEFCRRQCRERCEERKIRPSCKTLTFDEDGRRVFCCDWLGGDAFPALEGLNKLAWDVCFQAIMMSPADMNGDPTLSHLELAMGSFQDRLTPWQYKLLIERIGLIYRSFWLKYAGEKRREQGQ